MMRCVPHAHDNGNFCCKYGVLELTDHKQHSCQHTYKPANNACCRDWGGGGVLPLMKVDGRVVGMKVRCSGPCGCPKRH